MFVTEDCQYPPVLQEDSPTVEEIPQWRLDTTNDSKTYEPVPIHNGGTSTMNKHLVYCLLILSFCWSGAAQSKAPQNITKDIDPLALQILKAATDPIKDAKAFSFRALVSRDELGTNGQILTVFSTGEITLQRPNKLHVRFRGRGEPVEMFFDGSGKTVFYSPSVKFYTTVSTPTSIDATLDEMVRRGVNIATRNFLESDPYRSLTDELITAYAVGRVDLFDQKVYHLAFTEPAADWQLWVVGDDKPIIRRLEVIDKSKPHHPRTTIDFFDWDFSPATSDTMFTFSKPADAREIEMLKLSAEKQK
jgi:hypothetical protein